MKRCSIAIMLASLCALAACSSESEPSDDHHDALGLKLGDQGPRVRFLHDFLGRAGYFPNAQLSASFPSWHPLLESAPADAQVFDPLLREALRGYQSFHNLAITGEVDEATLAMMQQARCAHPDSFPKPSNEKFVISSAVLGEGDCKINTDSGANEVTFRIEETDQVWVNEFQAALSEWSRESSFRFREVSSRECILFEKRRPLAKADFPGIADPSAALAVTAADYYLDSRKIVHGRVVIGTHTTSGTEISWFTGTTVDPNKFSGRLAVLHEVGHALGIDHSGHPSIRSGQVSVVLDQPVMFPSVGPGDDTHVLTDDDKLALHFIAKTERDLGFERGVNTLSMDVTREGTYWEVDGALNAEGNGPLRCQGRLVDGWGVHVATDFSRAYHINTAGELYRNQGRGCDVSWERLNAPPLGHIAANNEGILWALGKDVVRGNHDREIYAYDGTRFVKFAGVGTRITVDPFGMALHVNEQEQAFFLNTNNPGCNMDWNSPGFGESCWQEFPAQGSETWLNVHAGKNSFVWLIGSQTRGPWVINSNFLKAGVGCDNPNDSACTWTMPAKRFGDWSLHTDIVTDGDSRVYLRAGLHPIDDGTGLGAGSLYLIR